MDLPERRFNKGIIENEVLIKDCTTHTIKRTIPAQEAQKPEAKPYNYLLLNSLSFKEGYGEASSLSIKVDENPNLISLALCDMGLAQNKKVILNKKIKFINSEIKLTFESKFGFDVTLHFEQING